MSIAHCLLTEDQFLCGVCLDVFTDPVALPCGHNFCKACVVQRRDNGSWPDCPSCREPFDKTLDLHVNGFISELATQFSQSSRKWRGPQVAGPGDVPCDVCMTNKKKSVRSCLVCLASFCDVHLRPHLTAARLKKHQLTDPLENPASRMCATHDKPLELFCNTDQTYVCTLCLVLDHRSHRVVPLKEQYERRRGELERRERGIQQMIRDRRLKMEDTRHAVELSKAAADTERADGVRFFVGLLRSLEEAWEELVGSITEKQTTAEEEAKGFLRELQQEVSELMTRQAELERLALTKDYLQFLQSFDPMKTPELTKDWTGVSVDVPSYEGTVRSTVDRLEATVGKDLKTLLQKAELNRARRSAVDVTLDPDTAHSALILSEDGKRVSHGAVRRSLPDGPDRFDPSCCVLGRQSFYSGKFYFEVHVGEKTRWTLGVADESIERKGILPLCPGNGHWTVWLKNGEEYAALVGCPRRLSLDSRPQTVGVFVDYDEGRVSFHDVDAPALLYRFTGCSFTGKLRPFFSPGLNDNGTNSAPVIIVDRPCGLTGTGSSGADPHDAQSQQTGM